MAGRQDPVRSQMQNAQRTGVGVLSRSASRNQPMTLQNGALLQRTLGNSHIGRAHAAPSENKRARSEPAGALSYSQQVMQSIVARGLSAQRSSVPQIQRLISAKDFETNTTVRKKTSKSNGFFASLVTKLQDLEKLPQTPVSKHSSRKTRRKAYDEWVARQGQMREIYRMANEWRVTDAKGSPRKAHVDSLLVELAHEMNQDFGQPAGPNLANTAQGTGSGPIVPTQNAKRTPKQKQAFKTIKSSNLPYQRRKHAYQMIRDPETIQQGAFGVCGLTSILYAVAKSSPDRFAEMIKDAWADTALVKQWIEIFYDNADVSHIQERAEVEFITAQWLVRKSTAGQQESKTLYQKGAGGRQNEETVTKKQDYTKTLENQRKFSDDFEIQGWENTFGHFALTAGALSTLLNALGTGKESYKIKKTTFKQDYARAKALAGKGSILASVVNTEFYKQNGAAVDVALDRSKDKRKKPPKYVHWVTLKDVTEDTDHYKLKIWTWRDNFDATVKKEHIDTYIHSLVVAEKD